MWPLPMVHWTSLYRDPSPWWQRLKTCSNMFTSGPPSADIWWLLQQVWLAQQAMHLQVCFLVTAHKRSLRRLCFYTCLSVILFTGGTCPGTLGRYIPRGRYTPRSMSRRHASYWNAFLLSSALDYTFPVHLQY